MSNGKYGEVYLIRFNLPNHRGESGEVYRALNSANRTVYHHAHRLFFHHPILHFLSFEPPYEQLRWLMQKHREMIASAVEKSEELKAKLAEPFSYVYRFILDRDAYCRLIKELFVAYDEIYESKLFGRGGYSKFMISVAKAKIEQLAKMLERCGVNEEGENKKLV